MVESTAKEEDEKEKEKDSTSSTINLANEGSIMYEILARLPAKSLLRFKAISKGFLELITDPAFARFRSRIRTSYVDGFFYHPMEWGGYLDCWGFLAAPPPLPLPKTNNNIEMDDDDADDEDNDDRLSTLSINLSFLQQWGNMDSFRVLDSLNGFLFCARNMCTYDHVATFSICNPLTMEWMRIPRPRLHKYTQVQFGLVADPASTHHFKVVCILEPQEGYSFEDIQIYSSQSGQWKSHDVGLPLSHYAISRSKAFFRGALYWDCIEGHILVCYLEQDRPWLIDAPYAPMGRSLWVFSDDCLLCCCLHGRMTDDYSLWSFSLDDCQWKDDHCTEFENMMGDISTIYPVNKGPCCPQLRLLGYDRYREIIFLWVPEVIFSYHVPMRVLEWTVGILVNTFWSSYHPFAYVDSLLVSPLMNTNQVKNKKLVGRRRQYSEEQGV